ncbi:PPOX class F420-dependent oxidoreductase [Smaragdicoccus niigatensis]|uniref:PPOX class F420-dependent oxidoreductase n=1 Tax=Smaragdicoccus niigatensis TaxID=359359 RepID=UPI000475E183|nr:PPOX class F420-dependent oxidoreductase [Smaragdicoccus niigatensis]
MTKEWEAVGKATYVAFTSYRKDGTPVATPVWIAPSDGKLYFLSETDAYKVKRLRRNAQVTLQACDIRGRVVEGAPIVPATARPLDPAETPRVRKILNRKYRILGPIAALGGKLTAAPGSRTPIEISPPTTT